PYTLRPDVEIPEPETEAGHTAPGREDARSPEGVPGQEAKRRDLETTIGGSWFNWIGIIAVTFGMAFFLKYAFDKQWIGPAGRVTLSALVGIGLLLLGDRLRGRGLKSYAYVLSGGGILILYLSDFAAYNLYHLISQPAAFALMVAVTTAAVLLSVRLDALPVAILGLVGGFLTPLLLSTGTDNEVGLFTYIALLDAGVLAVAYFKRWRSLDFGSFAGTVAITLGWAVTYFEPGKIWVTLFFLSVFFLLYSLLGIFHNVLPGRTTRWFDVALAMANAGFYFGLSYLLLVDAGFDHSTPATQAFLISIFFTGLFYITWRWSPDDLLLRYSYVGAAATFLTIAFAIQLELHWLTVAWAVEALMLTWVGLRSKETAARHAGLLVFCVAVSHWFLRDLSGRVYSADPSFLPLLNLRAASCAVLVGALAGAAKLYKRTTEIDADERRTMSTFFAITGNTLALTLLSFDINDYFTARMPATAADPHGPVENARQFSISILWGLYAAMILAVGILRRNLLLRAGGLLLLLAAIIKVIAIDSTYYAAWWHLVVFNHTFLAYAVLVAALAYGAWLYRRASALHAHERQAMVPILTGCANVLALTALTLEVIGYYDRLIALPLGNFDPAEVWRPLREGKVFTLVLVWTIYATAAFMVGVRRGVRGWRWGALLLLVITTPLVLASLNYYDAPWHVLLLNRTVGAFAILVASLWFVVRTYSRSGKDFEEATVVTLVATVAGNLLAITALSAQALGYYEAQISDPSNNPGAAAFWANLPGRRNLELAKQLSLSVVWALYGSGLLVVGQIRQRRLLRVMALALLSLTAIKVFLWDVSSLDRIYRIISFIMLGAILLVVSYFYQRRQQAAGSGQ
ncbi:MAG TPA: DUF2339 domain-containing protein, partial [Pyrinomonadaceae bacterium]|nr:DUF2339 domain-containing protein [Pyrinomonadaceae bacterium]